MIKEILQRTAQKEAELITKLDSKKEDISISKVFGTDLGGNHPAEWYDQIQKTIDNYKPEWKKYGQDGSKVIIQKDVALRTLAKKKNLFLFRDVKDKGETIVKLPVESKWYKEWDVEGFFFFIAFAIGLVLGLIGSAIFLSTKNPFPILGTGVLAGILALVFYGCFCHFFIRPRWEKNRLEWAERVRTDSKVIGVMHWDSWYDWIKAEKNYIKLQPSLKTENTELNDWYDEVIAKTVLFAGQVKGTKGLLWLHHVTQDNGDCPFDFSYGEYEYLGLEGIIRIGNVDNKASIIPFVETDNSFMFFFPKREEGFYEKNFVREQEHLVNWKLQAIDDMFAEKEEGMFLSFRSDEDEVKMKKWQEEYEKMNKI